MADPIAHPKRTADILKRHGFRFKKRLGQNFLTNPQVLQRIVTAAELGPADDVLEIGPGIGALTEFAAQAANRVLALEIDTQLLPVLAETMAPYPNVTVVGEDVLRADLSALQATYLPGAHPLKVVANLPYYITTPILLHLLQAPLKLTSMTVMMQKEVADRLSAKPGTKDYGALTIAMQQRMVVTTAFTVHRSAFVPAPNVDSAIVTLTRRATPLVKVADQAAFDRLVRASFAARRKTLWNNLQNRYGKTPAIKAQLEGAAKAAGIDVTKRAEQLTIADFAALSAALLATGIR